MMPPLQQQQKVRKSESQKETTGGEATQIYLVLTLHGPCRTLKIHVLSGVKFVYRTGTLSFNWFIIVQW